MFHLDYFFRAQPDKGISLPGYTSLINLLVIVWLFNVAKKYSKEDKILKRGAILNLFQQVSLYSWYFFETHRYLTEGLPLYYCRIVMLGLSLLILFNQEQKPLGQYLTYLGVFGGLLALLVPDIDSYHFPHITNFSYFIGHFVMLFNCFMLLFRNKAELAFSLMVKMTLTMTSIIFLLNLQLHTNYSYLLHLPNPINHPLPVALVFIIVNLVTLLGLYLTQKGQSYVVEKVEQKSKTK